MLMLLLLLLTNPNIETRSNGAVTRRSPPISVESARRKQEADQRLGRTRDHAHFERCEI